MPEISFELFNNQLIQQLVGPQDSNLRLIEKILNVEISSFGNDIKIKGPAKAAKQAHAAIDMLYNKLSKGIEINEQEVKAAVRIAGNDDHSKVDSQTLNELVLKTKKRHIYPRSATQALYIQEMMKNELVFGLGPAGTGKTYLAVALAVSMMLEGKIDKIILSRPAVEAGELKAFVRRTL
jgi:phosphate starvation-inducible PhoH-like protein